MTEVPEPVYCQWVNAIVKTNALPDACIASVVDGRCTVCMISPQLELGMSAADLLRNI